MPTKLIMAVLGGGAIVVILVANLAERRGQHPVPHPGSQSPIGHSPRKPRATDPAAIEHGLRSVVLAVRPTVVSIAADWQQQDPRPQSGMQLLEPFHTDAAGIGSGIIVDGAGHILTHRQVTRDAEVIQVTLFRSGRNSFVAHRIGVDPETGLVLYRLPFGGNLPAAHLGDSSRLRSGDIVMAVGSPFGLAETVTQGIVSASRRRVAFEGLGFFDLIQTDAATNQGNCGGPLVNIRGEVVGINLAIFSTDTAFSGIGFAIPSNRARAFYARTLQALL